MKTPVLTIERLSVRRGGRTVIAEFGLEIAAGEVVGVVGKNGCGKSSLLLAVAGVVAPRDGRIVVEGHGVWGGHAARAAARRAIGFVPENADPPGFLLGGELWAMVAACRGVTPPGEALRERLGLEELRDVAIDRMSLGQRRRACLGAALLGPPRLLVLDEPDNGLDARRLDGVSALIREQGAGGGAALVASHDAGFLEGIGARVVSL